MDDESPMDFFARTLKETYERYEAERPIQLWIKRKPTVRRRVRTQVASWVYRLGEWIDG